MWRWPFRRPNPLEELVTALNDAVARIGASADKVIAALQAAGTGGEDTTAAVDALNATSDRIDAAVAATNPAPAPAPAPNVQPIAGGTPEQPAG